jgi:hypothetical protein
LNLNLLSWLVDLSVVHLEAEELIRRGRNWPQYSDRRWMDLDDAIPVCHNVYVEPPDISRMTVATHEHRIIRAHLWANMAAAVIED